MVMIPTSLEGYLSVDVGTFVRRIQSVSADEWKESGEASALRTFHHAAAAVPAYKAFLEGHHVHPSKITSIQALQTYVPPTDKENYISQYAFKDLLSGGAVTIASLLNSSSGTTGRSYYWPTSQAEVAESSMWYESLFHQLFEAGGRSTLLIICFGMGSWIAGSYTYNATRFLDRKGYMFSTITPGFDQAHAAGVLDALRGGFDQVVVAGIPSFIRDFVSSLDLEPGRTRILLAGEGYTESWRDFILERVGSSRPTDVLSLYGSADAGLMGFETSASVETRRAAHRNPDLRRRMFGCERLPMLFQFVPTSRYYETCGGELLLTANRALPLVRYNLHDGGVVLPAGEIRSLLQEAEPDGDLGRPANNMPFVAVYGRGSFGATLYGANILAEQVQDLFHRVELGSSFSGRFLLETTYDESQNQRLEIHAELAGGAEPNPRRAQELVDAFETAMTQSSNEYRKILSEYGDRAYPIVRLHTQGSDRFPRDRQVKTT